MSKIIRLTESDLQRIVKRVLMEEVGKVYELQIRNKTGPFSKIKLKINKEYQKGYDIFIEGEVVDTPAPRKITMWFNCGKYNFNFQDKGCIVRGGVGGDNCVEYENAQYLAELKNKFCSKQKKERFRM